MRVLFISLLIAFLCGCADSDSNSSALESINKQLNVGEIKMGMLEDRVVEAWGEGEYIYGFGGDAREYEDKGITLGFSDDIDNDLYGKVSSIYFEAGATFSAFQIQVGDRLADGVEKLKNKGFAHADDEGNYYVKGEFAVALHGKTDIEMIRISFEDKDLKGRMY